MQSENELMQLAIRLATENVLSGAGGPFGAVIAKDGEIVATGVNTVTSANDPTAHAEVNAIREACRALGSFQLPGCVLYTSCEPCPMCLGAIYWARLDRVYFAATASDARICGPGGIGYCAARGACLRTMSGNAVTSPCTPMSCSTWS